MSSLQEIWTSRVNQTAQQDSQTGNIGNTFVGQEGRLWYNPDTNAVYVYGNVPGGVPVGLDSSANITIDRITANSGLINGNFTIVGNISPATTTKIGGVKAGPGANIANDGTLTIDTTGLPLSFGNFTANNNILSIVNVNENMILDTQGNAEIQLVGNIGFYKSNGGGAPDPGNVFFRALEDGQLFIYVTAQDSNAGAVEIIGSSTGNTITPGTTGTMLHVTGQRGDPCRLYYDGNGNYVSWVARRWNGNVANPTPVLAGEDVLRINATAATNAGVGNVAMAQISVMALENQTTTAQGSRIDFTVTPVGQPATSRIDVANISVANGVQATQFTTSGNVSATGNITGGNIVTGGLFTATGNVTGGNITTAGLVSATGGIASGDGITDSIGSVRSIPQNGKSTNYQLQATDNGQMINITSGNVTVPAGVFGNPFGQTISIFNNQNSSNAIVQAANVTIRLAGTAATGNRTLARYGLATLVCVGANTFVISGAGLT